MVVTKADTYTERKKQSEIYSDFMDSFAKTPIGGDLARLTNEDSVKQSVKNLVLTIFGERLFQPNIGTNVYKDLFEMNDAVNAASAKRYIEATLKYYETRANNLSVTVDHDPDHHTLTISVVFYVINNPNPIDLTVNLKRVR